MKCGTQLDVAKRSNEVIILHTMPRLHRFAAKVIKCVMYGSNEADNGRLNAMIMVHACDPSCLFCKELCFILVH